MSDDATDSQPDDPPPPLLLNLQVRGRDKLDSISHARTRMAERGIDVDRIVDTLIDPETEGPASKPPHLRVSKRRADGRVINVVFDDLPDRVRVISVF